MYPKWHATRPRFSKSSEVSRTSVGNLEIGTLDDTDNPYISKNSLESNNIIRKRGGLL